MTVSENVKNQGENHSKKRNSSRFSYKFSHILAALYPRPHLSLVLGSSLSSGVSHMQIM